MSARTRKATLTATLMLGERRMGACRASSVTSPFWAAENPVVPITARPPVRATILRWERLASGTENSMRMRSRFSTSSGSDVMGKPSRAIPATSPASLPIAPCPGASRAATSFRLGSSWSRATRRLPIRPAAPAITTSAMTFELGRGPRTLPKPPGENCRAETSAPEETVPLEGRPETRPIDVGHAAHGQTVLGLDHAQHRHGFLDGNRIGLDEHGSAQGEQLQMEIARELPVARQRGVRHLGGVARNEVRHYRNHSPATD